MTEFNAAFWEIQADSVYLENLPAERGLWFETEQDRQRRYALQDFFRTVLPEVKAVIESHLTPRQQQIITLYYFQGRTQEEIARLLGLTQSTVSRHLFGTVRDGRKVGGALTKLRKVFRKGNSGAVNEALQCLQQHFWATANLG